MSGEKESRPSRTPRVIDPDEDDYSEFWAGEWAFYVKGYVVYSQSTLREVGRVVDGSFYPRGFDPETSSIPCNPEDLHDWLECTEVAGRELAGELPAEWIGEALRQTRDAGFQIALEIARFNEGEPLPPDQTGDAKSDLANLRLWAMGLAREENAGVPRSLLEDILFPKTLPGEVTRQYVSKMFLTGQPFEALASGAGADRTAERAPEPVGPEEAENIFCKKGEFWDSVTLFL